MYKVFNFVEKKHVTNHNSNKRCVWIDPLTGNREGINMPGNFREMHNIIVCISANPAKQKHVFASVGQDNNNLAAFMRFVKVMVTEQFLCHGEILIIDNMTIHTRQDSVGMEDFL